MYKFKFDPPQEHRRSLQTHKNEHVPLINTLEKCTQILREDRLWLRNEIKNNNGELLNIFKQYPRSTQLQHLQIKLRKFVQNVKNKIKEEQLSKFRETLNAQNLSAIHNRSHVPMSQPKKQSQPKDLNNSHSRQHLKSNSSMELNKTTQFRPHKSQEPKQLTQMAMNSSLRHFQELLKYKCNQQVIEERESQNVTSARLARQENQQQSRPLQQLAYSSNFNRNNPIQNNYFKEGKGDSTINFRPKSNIQSTSFSNDKTNSWQFQQMAKRALYHYQPKYQAEEKQWQREYEDSNPGNFSRFNRESQQAEESIMDKHFIDESLKISPRREIAQSIKNNGIQLKNSTFSRQYTNKNQQINKNHDNKFSPKYKSTLQLKQSSFSTLNENKTKQIIENLPDSDRNNEENLFTPLQLLNQCRNFLKSRENSISKATVSQPHFQETFKPCQISQLQSQCLFSRNNYQQNVLSLREHPSQRQNKVQRQEKEEESAFMYPEIKSPEEKVNNISSIKDQTTVCYPHFQTFANASNEKNSFEKALNPPQYIRPSTIKEPIPIKTEQPSSIPANFSIEDLLNDMLQQTEMNPFISIDHLNQYIGTHSQNRMLRRILSQYCKLSKNQQVCLTTIAEVINLAFNKEHEDSYPHNDHAINEVYDLLDIDQKGYISREDIESFLNQIQQAEVSNFDEVSEEMLRLFDGADFTNEQRLTYWHLYIVKNSEEFERVSQLLGEFQFQIEREV